jgi:FkbM family methyltransferase
MKKFGLARAYRHLVMLVEEFLFGKDSLPSKLDPRIHQVVNRSVDFSFSALLITYQFTQRSLLVIGANKGEELLDPGYSRFEYVVAFEPIRYLEGDLRSNLARFSKSRVFSCAAGSSNYTSFMFIADNNGQSSSLLEPLGHLEEAPHVKFENQLTVEVRRIDTLLDQTNCPDVWVVDVQGLELEAIRGAGNLLQSCEALYVEVNRSEVYKGCTKVKELDEYLRPYGLRRAATRWWGGWGDAVYLREPLQRTTSPKSSQ